MVVQGNISLFDSDVCVYMYVCMYERAGKQRFLGSLAFTETTGS